MNDEEIQITDKYDLIKNSIEDQNSQNYDNPNQKLSRIEEGCLMTSKDDTQKTSHYQLPPVPVDHDL